jgi:hypothetical protein
MRPPRSSANEGLCLGDLIWTDLHGRAATTRPTSHPLGRDQMWNEKRKNAHAAGLLGEGFLGEIGGEFRLKYLNGRFREAKFDSLQAISRLIHTYVQDRAPATILAGCSSGGYQSFEYTYIYTVQYTLCEK